MKKIFSVVLYLALCNVILLGWSYNNEVFKEKIYTSNTQIRELILDVQDREIEVSLSQDDQIHIHYSESNKEYYDIFVSGNVLSMTSVTNKEWTDYIGFKPAAQNRKISVHIPSMLLTKLSISTTNQDVILSPLTITGSIDISSTGGNITFKSLDVGNTLILNAKNGNISGTIAGSYDDFSIQSNSKKGDSNMPKNKQSGNKTLKVSCNNGDINIEFVAK